MPECVGIDVGEAVTLAELGKPTCYAIRVQGLSIIPSKQKALILVVFAQPQPFFALPRPVFFEKAHCFSGE